MGFELKDLVYFKALATYEDFIFLYHHGRAHILGYGQRVAGQHVEHNRGQVKGVSSARELNV